MRKLWLAAAILVLTFPSLASAVELKVGDQAPDFTLMNTDWQKVSLHDFLGKKNVVLAFYVLAFTGG
jgi:peroxiredoxin